MGIGVRFSDMIGSGPVRCSPGIWVQGVQLGLQRKVTLTTLVLGINGADRYPPGIGRVAAGGTVYQTLSIECPSIFFWHVLCALFLSFCCFYFLFPCSRWSFADDVPLIFSSPADHVRTYRIGNHNIAYITGYYMVETRSAFVQNTHTRTRPVYFPQRVAPKYLSHVSQVPALGECVCTTTTVVIKLLSTAQSGPAILVILCHSQ